MRLNVNSEKHELKGVAASTPLLWVLRDDLGLVGTKYGCGGGFCGACTVHVDGVAARSCTIRASDVQNVAIRTIEGLAPSDEELHPLQREWITLDVPQCGYCQAGQTMSAAALLHRTSSPSDAEIDAAMQGNLCRCGCYVRIKAAIRNASTRLNASAQEAGS